MIIQYTESYGSPPSFGWLMMVGHTTTILLLLAERLRINHGMLRQAALS